MKISLYDDLFDHSLQEDGFYTVSAGKKPQKIEWVKNSPPHDIAVFTESHFDIAPTIDSKIKIAWLVESKVLHAWAYEKIKEIENNFDFIFTHDKSLIERFNKYKEIYVGASRIKDENVDKLFEKNKGVSLIASHKRMTAGHIFRHEVARKNFSVDLWGSAYKPFIDKEEALGEYMYSIVILNGKYDYYFNEALIDCFMHKTIPIFWGCPSINKFFDINGIYEFDTMKDLEEILDKISPDDYNSRLEYVNKNYKIAKNKFMSTDDIVADKIKELVIDIQ